MPGQQPPAQPAQPQPHTNALAVGHSFNANGHAVTVSLPNGAPNTTVTVDGTQHTLSGTYALILQSANTITNGGPSTVSVTTYG